MVHHQPIKAILLDLDGTLADSLQIHTMAWERMLKDHLGVTLNPGALKKYIGTPSPVILQDFAPHEQIPVSYHPDFIFEHPGELLNLAQLVEI